MSCPVALSDKAMALSSFLPAPEIFLHSFQQETGQEGSDPLTEAVHKAEALLQEAAELSPQGRTLIQMACAYINLGEPKHLLQARECLQKAAELCPDNPAVSLFSAMSCMGNGSSPADLQEAQKHLERLRTICPANQALPSAQALWHLRQGEIATALEIMCPPHGDFDLTVSPLILGQLCQAVEEHLLPQELPSYLEPDLTIKDSDRQMLLDCLEENREKNSPQPAQEIAVQAQDTAISTPAPENDKAEDSAPAQDKGAKVLGNLEFPKDDTPTYVGPLISGSVRSLTSKGLNRLHNSWNLEPQKRAEAIDLAIQELGSAYVRSPKGYQMAYNYAEALLAQVIYGHPDRLGVYPQDMRNLFMAQRLLKESLKCDNDSAFILHYLANCAFLQKQFAFCETCERLALSFFEKFPEAHYLLGQVLTITGHVREGRLWFLKAISSDLSMLRERLKALKQSLEATSK